MSSETMEKALIAILSDAPTKDMQALILESYIQKYGAISDANGEVVRRILTEGSDT